MGGLEGKAVCAVASYFRRFGIEYGKLNGERPLCRALQSYLRVYNTSMDMVFEYVYNCSIIGILNDDSSIIPIPELA